MTTAIAEAAAAATVVARPEAICLKKALRDRVSHCAHVSRAACFFCVPSCTSTLTSPTLARRPEIPLKGFLAPPRATPIVEKDIFFFVRSLPSLVRDLPPLFAAWTGAGKEKVASSLEALTVVTTAAATTDTTQAACFGVDGLLRGCALHTEVSFKRGGIFFCRARSRFPHVVPI